MARSATASIARPEHPTNDHIAAVRHATGNRQDCASFAILRGGLRTPGRADYLCGQRYARGDDQTVDSETETPAKKGGFTVELARSGVEYFIPEGETILNVLLDAGIDIDYSCELGICGACEQRVISGVPEHRDSILSEDEQAANTRVMICCAGCKTDRLVLDL